MGWSRSQAERALERLTALLAGLGLEPKAAKTRIVHLEEGAGGFDFLGFHHRLVRSRGLNGKRPVTLLARWPADKAMQHARDRIRELTRRSRLLLPVKWIVEDVNRFLSGWAAFFRFGNSTARFEKIRSYPRIRLVGGHLPVPEPARAVRREKPAWMHLMAMRRRKTLVTCRRCHEDIHAGRATRPYPK